MFFDQNRFEEAKSEALCAADVYEGIGTTRDVEGCSVILRNIEEKMKTLVISGESDLNDAGKSLETVLLPTFIDPPSSVQGAE